MQVISVFPTPIFVQDINLTDIEQNTLASVHTNTASDRPTISGESDSEIWTNLSENKQVLRLEELKNIRNNIIVNSKKFANEIMGYDIKGMVDVLSWTNQKPSDREHRTHTHPNSFVSGVLYFDDHYDENESIIFEKHPGTSTVCQLIPKKNHKIKNDFSTMNFAIPAQKGRLILFPSYMPHFVPKTQSGKTRRSLAFNLMPEGSLGDIMHLTEFQYMSALTV